MARIDWLTACELAFFDRQDRLCMVGMTTRLPVPRVPVILNELMLVARLADLQMIEELAVRVEIVMPSGLFSCPHDDRCLSIEMAGEYVLVTLRGLPIAEEGVYRFLVAVNNQEPAEISIPVIGVGVCEQPAKVN